MIKNDQNVFRYCDKNGTIIDEFPTNAPGVLGILDAFSEEHVVAIYMQSQSQGSKTWKKLDVKVYGAVLDALL